MKLSMLNLQAVIGLFIALVVPHAAAVTVEVWGDASTAPIYTLDGSASTDLTVGNDNDILVHGEFEYVTDAASPKVYAFGDYKVTRDSDWNADIAAASRYLIKVYGDIVEVDFDHLASKQRGGAFLADGVNCAKGQIRSYGSMTMSGSSGSYILSGTMSGFVRGQNAKGRVIKNCYYSNEPFTQSFTLDASADWGEWYGKWTFNNNAKNNKVTGSGTLYIGSDPAPDTASPQCIDKVAQTVSGSFSGGVFSWTAAGKAKADKGVRVKITYDDNAKNLVNDGNEETEENSVTAVGQKRVF